ncbi:MAG TPA: hypothetical protein RMH99_17690 [Sandaracinaceae bacterium LLY-WYZ-13_1]|nr:hypothetical protein [Sandaracinaceae bacterium LLY-WYZ-13_1]
MKIQKHRFGGLLGSLAVVALFVVVAWFVASLFGFHFSLWMSLLLSLVLTAALNLVTGGFRRRRHG